jgi:hypothetical protein
LLQVNLVGQRQRVTSAFTIRISTIDLGASGLSSTLTEEWLTQMQLPAAMYPGRPLSTCADAVLHGIEHGRWDARRLPSRISRVPRMRADAARSRCPVFRAGPNWNASHGRRQHAQPVSRPKGHAAIAHRFICVGSALMEVADHGECAGAIGLRCNSGFRLRQIGFVNGLRDLTAVNSMHRL